MRWTGSVRRPLLRAATSSISNRSSSSLCSPPFGVSLRTRNNSRTRQPHREYPTLAPLACHGHIAAHHARKLAGGGETQTGAAEALPGRDIGLGELLEQFRLLLGSQADAGVGHCNLDPVASVDESSRSQLDLALLGEFAGVAQEIEQNLP